MVDHVIAIHKDENGRQAEHGNPQEPKDGQCRHGRNDDDLIGDDDFIKAPVNKCMKESY